jgi:hypothetical protein
MTKKFGAVVHREGECYVARVVRRRTSRGTTIEREQAGFTDHASAAAWGQAALAEYLAARHSRNTRKAENRRTQQEHGAWLETQTLRKLAEISRADKEAASVLQYRAELLWAEVGFRALKRGEDEDTAIELANRMVGKNATHRLEKALSGDLDAVHEATTDMALSNAVRLAQIARDMLSE